MHGCIKNDLPRKEIEIGIGTQRSGSDLPVKYGTIIVPVQLRFLDNIVFNSDSRVHQAFVFTSQYCCSVSDVLVQ